MKFASFRETFFKTATVFCPLPPPIPPQCILPVIQSVIKLGGFLKIFHHFSKTHTDLLLTYFSTGCDRCTVGGNHGNG